MNKKSKYTIISIIIFIILLIALGNKNTSVKAVDNEIKDVKTESEDNRIHYSYILEPKFDGMGLFTDTYTWVKNKTKDGERYGYVNIHGDICVPVEYSDIKYSIGASGNDVTGFSEGRFVVQKEGKWGYVTLDGEEDIKYDDAYFYYNYLAAVKYEGKYGYVDKKGVFAIEPIYEDALVRYQTHDTPYRLPHRPFDYNITFVKTDEGYVFIDKRGNIVLDKRYDCVAIKMIDKKYPKLFLVEKDDKYGIVKIEEEGIVKEIVEPKYHYLPPFQRGKTLAKIYKRGEEGYFIGEEFHVLDKDGTSDFLGYWEYEEDDGEKKERYYEQQFQNILEESEEESQTIEDEGILDSDHLGDNFKIVQKENKYGIVDIYGNNIAPCIFDEIKLTRYGTARVKINEKYGLIALDYIINHIEEDINGDGKNERIEFVYSSKNDLILKIDNQEVIIMENYMEYREPLNIYLEKPHIKVISAEDGKKKYIGFALTAATNKIGSTACMKIFEYDKGKINKVFSTGENNPKIITWYDSKFHISIPEYNYEKEIDVSLEELVEKANINPSILKELKEKREGVVLSTYTEYDFDDIDGDGFKELIFKRMGYLESSPFYFSQATEVYDIKETIDIRDFYFNEYK